MQETTAIAARPAGKVLNTTLWVSQALLALVFLLAGGMKLLTPAAKLSAMPLPLGLIRFIGVAGVAGAIGVVLPAAIRILPLLTPLAAVGLAIVMVLATGFNVTHGMATMAWIPLLIGADAVFVAWGRASRAPIAPR